MRRPVAPAPLPVPLIVIASLFLAVMAWLVVGSFTPRRVPTFPPGPPRPPRLVAGVPDTVTLDARDAERWRFYAFAAGPLTPPDTAGWDLAVRRFHLIAAGAVARLDTTGFEAVRAPPSGGYVATTFDRDTVNRAIARWYRYSMFSHLLRPSGHVYVVRSRAGTYVKLEILSYYCPGPQPGCVTIRFEPL